MIEIFMKQDKVTPDELHELSNLIQQIKNMERVHDSTFTSAITLFENKHIFEKD
jgi:rubrerythrin